MSALGRELAFEVGGAHHQRVLLEDAVQHVSDLRGRERLGQVIPGASPHRLYRGFDGGVGRDDHDGSWDFRRAAAESGPGHCRRPA